MLLNNNVIGFSQVPSVAFSKRLIYWVDAGMKTYNNDTGGAICKNGEGVARWEDLSGNKWHAINGAGTLSVRPTLDSRAANGMPALYFDGNDTLVNSLANVRTNNITMFLVYKPLTNLTNAQSAVRYQISTGPYFSITYSTDARIISFNDGALTGIQTGTVANAWNILSIKRQANVASTGLQCWRNGVLQGSRTTAAGDISTTTGMYFGSFIASLEYFTGYIASFMQFNDVLTDNERQNVEDFLGARYRIPIIR